MGVGRFRLALAAGFVGVLLAATAAHAEFAWDPEATFDPPEPADLYGRAVALDDPTLVTGAPGDDTLLPNAGAVWVHSRAGDGTCHPSHISSDGAAGHQAWDKGL